MSDDRQRSVDEMRSAAADHFDRDLDPLAKFEEGFEANGIDPIFMFEAEVLDAQDLAERTQKHYDVTFRQWRRFMAKQGRHPACPSERHVQGFIEYLRDERGNTDDTIRQKLNRVNRAYEYWQNDDGLPHPNDFNPFQSARSKTSLSANDKKPVPRIPLDELREIVADIDHVLYKSIIVVQLKLGLRRGELCNIQLQDVNLQHAECQDFYDQLGTHPMVADRPNAIYVPPRDERDGNKSTRPRVLPLDDETRLALIRYLLIRPTVDDPWLFLAKRSFGQLRSRSVNEAWKEAFHPEYSGSERYREMTSHFARHYFSNYWETELAARGRPLKYIQYMRGDKIKAEEFRDHAIDHYLATYYEDVEELYTDGIYRLGLTRV